MEGGWAWRGRGRVEGTGLGDGGSGKAEWSQQSNESYYMTFQLPERWGQGSCHWRLGSLQSLGAWGALPQQLVNVMVVVVVVSTAGASLFSLVCDATKSRMDPAVIATNITNHDIYHATLHWFTFKLNINPSLLRKKPSPSLCPPPLSTWTVDKIIPWLDPTHRYNWLGFENFEWQWLL